MATYMATYLATYMATYMATYLATYIATYIATTSPLTSPLTLPLTLHLHCHLHRHYIAKKGHFCLHPIFGFHLITSLQADKIHLPRCLLLGAYAVYLGPILQKFRH